MYLAPLSPTLEVTSTLTGAQVSPTSSPCPAEQYALVEPTGVVGQSDPFDDAVPQNGGVVTSTSAATSEGAGTSTGVSFALRWAAMRFDR
jgi:hypothetical protein